MVSWEVLLNIVSLFYLLSLVLIIWALTPIKPDALNDQAWFMFCYFLCQPSLLVLPNL